MNRFPTQPGFYWWRANKSDSWRVVRIEDVTGMGRDFECADVSKSLFASRSLMFWQQNTDIMPCGEWLLIEKPKF